MTVDISNLDYLIKKNHSLKYIKSTTLGQEDIRISKFKFVAKTQYPENGKNNCFQIYLLF